MTQLSQKKKAFSTIEHNVDLCVVGAGLSGMGAAITAARHGMSVLLMHDRPMPGGNASSEIRMWPCGCAKLIETGLIEELRLESLATNPEGHWPEWDIILYGKLRTQKNLTVLYNCSCLDAEMDGNTITSITGWQGTTQQFHKVTAQFFADCSGDSILAPLTDAQYTVGREARKQYDESLAPQSADSKTMGMSCILQAREDVKPHKFTAPDWAMKYPTEESFPPDRGHLLNPMQNFWWVELGGEQNSIADTETTRDDLIAEILGVWDHIKNNGEHGADNFAIDWLGFLPGKRESRRYVGLVTVTQKDILSGGNWDDAIAYGGWPIDDHHPGGIRHRGIPNTNIIPEQPYTLPLRALCSINIDNLLFAGRNISVSHVALSSTRVMATCMQLGQAAGSLAYIAWKSCKSLKETTLHNYRAVQDTLLDDDATIPGLKRNVPASVLSAHLTATCGNAEQLRSGILRPASKEDLEQHFCKCASGDEISYSWDTPTQVSGIRLVTYTDLVKRSVPNAQLVHAAQYLIPPTQFALPGTILRDFDILADGKVIHQIRGNFQRFCPIAFSTPITASTITLRPLDNTPKYIISFEVF